MLFKLYITPKLKSSACRHDQLRATLALVAEFHQLPIKREGPFEAFVEWEYFTVNGDEVVFCCDTDIDAEEVSLCTAEAEKHLLSIISEKYRLSISSLECSLAKSSSFM